MNKYIRTRLFILLLFVIHPTYASSYDLDSFFTILIWLVITNFIPFMIVLAVVIAIIWTIKKDKQPGYYIQVSDIEIWQKDLLLVKERFDKHAEAWGIDNYQVICESEVIELKNNQQAKPNRVYQIISLSKE